MIRMKRQIDMAALTAFRAIRETETFLEEAIRHPERHAHIPVVRVGRGAFPPAVAQSFWNEVLELAAP